MTCCLHGKWVFSPLNIHTWKKCSFCLTTSQFDSTRLKLWLFQNKWVDLLCGKKKIHELSAKHRQSCTSIFSLVQQIQRFNRGKNQKLIKLTLNEGIIPLRSIYSQFVKFKIPRHFIEKNFLMGQMVETYTLSQLKELEPTFFLKTLLWKLWKFFTSFPSQ